MQISKIPLLPKEQKLHDRAVAASTRYLQSQGELLDLVEQVDRTRLYEKFLLRSSFAYCIAELNLSEDVTHRFLKVARAARVFPALREAVHAGLPVSKARRIVPVLTEENHKEWIEKANRLSYRELEKEVARACPIEASPERLKPISAEYYELVTCLDSETASLLHKVQDLLSTKRGHTVTFAETIANSLEVFVHKHDPVVRSLRARNTSIARHAVYRRDHGECQAIHTDGKKCQERRWLHIHHRLPRAEGGGDELENLVLLCSFHHRMFHRSHATKVNVS